VKYKRISLIGALVIILLFIFYLQKDKSEHVSPGISFIKENGISLEEYGVKGDGITDDTENFQIAIDDAVKKKKILIVPANTYKVSPLKYRNPDFSDWGCLYIPSEAQIYFEKGAVLKLVDNAPDWSRVIVISGVSNVEIYGHLEVDGNAETVKNGNEHMAGIFIYDSRNIFIESAYSHDSYGDNLFIGGLEENYSDNVKVNYFKGVTAGRKNLVIHYVDNLHIGTAVLDNSQGGVGGNWTGENSLDLEPDDYAGKKSFYQRIDYLSTYGKGNDFTVGTKKKLAKKWVLDIGNFNVVLMDGSIEGLISYAITVKINKLFIKSSSKNEDVGINLSYAAIWEINEAYFVDGRDYAIRARMEGGEKPSLKLGDIFISRPSGKGIELWGADAKIDYLEANTIDSEVMNIFSTYDQQVTIQKLITRNSGQEEIIYVSDNGNKPIVKVGELSVSDDRTNKAHQIIYLDTQKAVDGFEITNIRNFDNLSVVSFGPSVTNKDVKGMVYVDE